jgi:archaellum component FlaC
MEKLKNHPTLGYNYQQMGDKINELIDEQEDFQRTTVDELNAQGKYINKVLMEQERIKEAIRYLAEDVPVGNIGIGIEGKKFLMDKINQILN